MNTSSTRNWLITGGSGGMGSAIARAAIHAGDTVIVTARNPEAMADLAGSPGALLMALDVTDSAAIARVVQAAQEK